MLREIKGGRESAGEKHRSPPSIVRAPTGSQTQNPGMCPHQESDQQPFGAWDELNQLSPLAKAKDIVF